MRRLLEVLLLSLTALSVSAEDYQCIQAAGCPARGEEDGQVFEVLFRKGDIISTEAGWLVSPSDGWAKVRTRMVGWIGQGQLYLPELRSSVPTSLVTKTPKYQRGWASPLVPWNTSIPVSLSLIGLL